MAIDGCKMQDGTLMAKTPDGEYVPIGKFRDLDEIDISKPYDSHILTNPMGEYPAWRSCYECQPRHRDDKFDATRYALSFIPGRTNGKTYTIDDILAKGDIEKTMRHDNFITTILTHVARATNEAPFIPKSIEVSADHKTVVVIWIDGSKTMVKRSNNDPDDIYMAFTAALAKRIFSTNSRIKKVIREKVNYHLPKEQKGENHEQEETSV